MLHTWEKIKAGMKKRQAKSQAKIRQEFLPEALEIVEKPVSPMGHLMLVLIVLIVLFFAGWSVFGRLDEVVTARGIIITVSGIQEIQAANEGIVEEICVHEGESVKAGQPIIKIDSSIHTINLQSTTKSIELLEYENELLRKLMEGGELVPENGAEKEKETIYHYVEAMRNEYESQRGELDSTIQQMSSQIEMEKEALSKCEENYHYLVTQKEALTEILKFSNVEEYSSAKIALDIQYKEKNLEDYKKLYEAGAVAKAEVEALEIELAKLRKDYERQSSLIASEDYDNSTRKDDIENQLQMAEKDCSTQKKAVELAEEKYNQALNSLKTLEADFKSNLSNLIVQNQNNISAQTANQEVQKITVAEQTLVSPVDGIVKTMEINTIGGVVTTSQTVSTIVPDNLQMIVEIDVLNRDIGYIQNGQEVVIKLDTFDFQEYGKLEGVVVFVSPDAVWNDLYGWVYKAKIAIDEEKFKQKNPGIEIGVGMECTAEVKVDERRIIEFFLEPIVEHFDGSLKIK